MNSRVNRITIDDMGANAEVVVFNVVFTGKDWRERYRAMLDRLRRGGPGELEHPEGLAPAGCCQGSD